jgi:tetratricopeptide (TPR) repeat protein
MMPQNTPAPAPKMPFSKVVNWKGLALFLLLTVASFGALFYLNLNLFGAQLFKGTDLVDLTVDDNGYTYIANINNARIEKQDAQGNVLATYGRAGFGDGGLYQYSSEMRIAVDKAGNVFVAQSAFEDSVQKFDPAGRFLYKIKFKDFTVGRIAVDSRGDLYVVTYDEDDVPTIRKYGADGTALFALPGGAFDEDFETARIAVDAQDNLLVLDTAAKVIHKVSPDGKPAGKITLAKSRSAYYFDVDSAGNIYTSFTYGIAKFDANGNKLAEWGGKKGDLLSAGTYALSVDRQDNINILTNSEGGFQTITKLNSNGQVVARRTIGTPFWLMLSFVIGGPILLVFLLLPLHKLAVRRLPLTEELLNGQPLPPQIRWAIQSNTVYPDHLDLRRLENSSVSAQVGISMIVGSLIGFLLPIVGIIIGFVLFFLSGATGDLGSWLLYTVMGLLALNSISITLKESLKEEYTFQVKHLPIIAQALGTLPAANRSVLIGSRKFSPSTWINGWLFIGSPLLAYHILNYFGVWPSSIPGWLIENALVLLFVVAILGFVTLVNAVVAPKPGQVKLSRPELFSLYRIAARYIGIYLLITSAVQIGIEFAASQISFIEMLSLLVGWIVVLVKLYYLAVVFGIVDQRWIAQAQYTRDYDNALRRISFIRRFVDSPNGRIAQIPILVCDNRLAEAEYLVQESLTLRTSMKAEHFAILLTMLHLIRLVQDRYAESGYWLEQAIELNPNLQVYASGLGETYLWAGIYPDRALQLADHSKKSMSKSLLPGVSTPYMKGDLAINQAWALAQLGRHAEAEPLIGEAIAKANADKNSRFLYGISSIHFRAGKIRELQGNWAGASQHYWQAYELDPTGFYGQRAALYAGTRQELGDRG